MNISSRLQTAVKVIFLLWFILAMYLQHNVGLADNGDYARSMAWISSGPIGIEPNWPTVGTDHSPRRFLDYWIPFWNLEWNISASTIPATSAIILWLPGALLSYYFYSPKILYLPLLSLFPKALLLGILLLLFKWIGFQARYRLFFLFGLGVPITFLITSTDYVAYFNSFYQETASFIFLFLFLASILALKRRPSFGYLLLNLVLLLFLTTSKASNVYWPLIALPFVFYIWPLSKKIKLRTKLIVGLALILTFTFVSQRITARGSVRNPSYHSLFYGVLTFSENPSEHLHRLGFDGAMQCINTTSFSAIGNSYFAKYQKQMTYQNTLDVVYEEPAVLFRFFKYALDNMQNTNLAYLGKYAFDDPRNMEMNPTVSLLNLWGLLKLRFFPVGYTLAFVLIVFLGWFIIGLKRTGFYQELSIIGLISTIACLTDITVAILGDGKLELPKHLFLSNVLFDVAVIVFFNSVLLSCYELAERKLSKSNSHKFGED
jgi:hypothetical protein